MKQEAGKEKRMRESNQLEKRMREAQRLKGTPLEVLSLLSLLALLVQQYTYSWRRGCARLSASREPLLSSSVYSVYLLY
jgi:hypothetical protein